MPRIRACSGSRLSGVIPGCVFVSSTEGAFRQAGFDIVHAGQGHNWLGEAGQGEPPPWLAELEAAKSDEEVLRADMMMHGVIAEEANNPMLLWMLNAAVVLNVAAWVCLFTVILIPVAVVLWIVAAVLLVVCHVLAVLKANKGEVYRYPLQLPVLQ